jgi:Flp pilus assembly protein TadD
MKPATTIGPPRKKLGRVAVRWMGLALIGGILYGVASFWREKQTDAQLERAESALAHRDFAQARTDLQEYLSVRPKDGEAHWLLARTERRSMLYDPTKQQWEARVLHHLAESSKAKYDPEALELESALFGAARGELPRVQSYLLQKLVQHHPDSPIILEALIPAYLASHLLPQAMDQVTRLLAIDSENAQAYYWRGLIREQLLFNHLATADLKKPSP